MADFKIRNGNTGTRPSGNLTRPNGSQYRPTGPGEKRVIVEKTVAPSTGVDRFALHTVGNTKISINGQDVSVMTEYDPDYNLTAYSAYEMAQRGIFVDVPSADGIINNFGPGSTSVIEDFNGGEDEEGSILGIPLEFYALPVTGSPINVTVTALRDAPPLLPEPSMMAMSITPPVGNSPLGVSVRRKHYDQSALMASSDSYVTLTSTVPTKGSCVVTPMSAKKFSWLAYYPAILKPPLMNNNTEAVEHTLGIVLSLNGGSPKLIKYATPMRLISQGDTSPNANIGDWRQAIIEIMLLANNAFRSELFEYLKRDSRLNAKYQLTNPNGSGPWEPNFFDGMSDDLFQSNYNGSGGAFSLSGNDMQDNSMQYVSMDIGGFSEFSIHLMGGDDNREVLQNPLYLTVHPNHSLLKSDLSVTIDLGVESLYNQNSTLKPFNVHSSVFQKYMPA